MLQPKKPTPRVLSAKRPLLHNRRGTPRPHQNHKSGSPEHSDIPQTKKQSNILQLPPINKSEINLTSATPHRQRSSGRTYLATSSLLQPQNQLHVRRTRDLETKLSDDGSECDSNLTGTVNQPGRRGSQQHKLPPVVSTFIPLSGSLETSNGTGNNRHLLDMKWSQNTNYGQGRGTGSRSCREKTKNSKEDLSLSGSQAVSVIPTPNIAIVGKEEPDFTSPPNHILVPSKEATTFTVSQIHQKRVRTPISNSQNRYRVSRFIIDDDDRPKTSPDELTQRQEAAKELCNILSETKWHRQEQQRRVHCSNSQLEVLGDLPLAQKRNESNSQDFVQQEVRSTIDLTVPQKSSVINVTTQSPRYGRRSGMLLSTKCHDKNDKVEHDAATIHQTELNLNSDSVRQSKRLSSSGHGNLLYPAHKRMELAPQSLPLVPTKKQSTVRSRCAECRKRLNITNVYTCRCDKLFCAAHRYSELHNCTFDYKSDGRKILEQTNPLVTAPKLPKI